MSSNPELAAHILAFLADRSQSEFPFKHDRWTFILLKSKYDEETDFLYLLHEYNAPTAHTMRGHADYAGIYSHLTSTLYGYCYDLNFMGDQRTQMTTVCDNLVQLITEAILRKVTGRPVPVEPDSEDEIRRRAYYLRYDLKREALDCFYTGKQPCFSPRIDREQFTIADIVGAINHPTETAERLADAYILEHGNSIDRRRWELSLLPDKVAELEATPSEHHYRRAIARSIGREKNVHLEIQKDGVTCSCKISTDTLKCSRDSYYSDWHMDAPSRAIFHKTYGKPAQLYPADILRITYGKKTLYEKEALV